MIKVMFVDRYSWCFCYASCLSDAIETFKSYGLSGAAKEVGTDVWTTY